MKKNTEHVHDFFPVKNQIIFFLQKFFLWNQNCQQQNKEKSQSFHDFFSVNKLTNYWRYNSSFWMLHPLEQYSAHFPHWIEYHHDWVSTYITVFENHRKKSHSTLRAKRAYILRGQKLLKNSKNVRFWRVFENLKLAVKQCYQTGQF